MKTWDCPEPDCRRTFRRKYHLERHQDNTHIQVRPHTCGICNRSFARHDALIRHVRFHVQKANSQSRERAFFACDRCHSRKVRCDNKTPCSPCQKSNAECRRSIPPEVMGEDISFISARYPNAEHSPASSSNYSSEYISHMAHAADHSDSGPMTEPSFSHTTQSLTINESSYSTQMGVTLSQQTEEVTSRIPSELRDSVLPNGETNPVRGDRTIQGINYMDLAAVIEQEPVTCNGSPVATGLMGLAPQTTSSYAPSPGGVYSTGSHQTSCTPYSSYASEGAGKAPDVSCSSYCSHLDGEATFYPEHRDTIHAIFHESVVKKYFLLVHPLWPILHQESFRQETVPFELRCAVALLGSLVDEHSTNLDALKSLQRTLCFALQTKVQQQYGDPTIDPARRSHLLLSQALLLSMLFAFYLQEKLLLSAACLQMGNLLSWVRYAGFFHIEDIISQDDVSATEWSRWILREQKMRIAIATFRLDAQLHFLLDSPALMRFQEIDTPFISTDLVWNARSSKEWEYAMTQEPSTRNYASFSTLCALSLSRLSPSKRLNLPGFFTTHDFELGMCAMQSRLWEETKQFQIANKSILDECELSSSEIANLHGFGHSWPIVLDLWRVTMEQFRPASKAYWLSALSERVSYLTNMAMYHASMLRAYADISFLRRLAACLNDERGQRPSFLRQYELRVQQWTRSNIARDALWHAAQILHLATEEMPVLRGQNIMVNPVNIECVFRAALVAWAFCRSSLICSLCSALSASAPAERSIRDSTTGRRNSTVSSVGVQSIELTQLEKHSELYDLWLREGGSTVVDRVLVCACCMPDLVEKYRKVISESTHHESSVSMYLAVLDSLKKRQ